MLEVQAVALAGGKSDKLPRPAACSDAQASAKASTAGKVGGRRRQRRGESEMRRDSRRRAGRDCERQSPGSKPGVIRPDEWGDRGLADPQQPSTTS